MSDSKSDNLKHEIDGLEKAMYDADQFRTLEEQVADMKRRGVDPSKAYKDLDRKAEDEDWGDDTWKDNGKWRPKTPADLDEKARENWGGDNGDLDPPPIV
ncbi:hypothetical protein [uncultured Psychrobacter sp.]|uniref:hypothetical protein n=1 Tax=uncultured Psychrobacter sp. TaxID=259303 RepID=UPI0034588BA8